MSKNAAWEQSLDGLREAMQTAEPKTFELMAADLISRLLGMKLYVARSGFQHGADAGTTGAPEVRLRIECKRYLESSNLNGRELKGEIDDALDRDPDLDAWALITTRSVDLTLRDTLERKSKATGLPIVIVDWKGIAGQLPELATLCASAPDLVEEYCGAEAGKHADTIRAHAGAEIESLRNDLKNCHIGYQFLKQAADSRIQELVESEQQALAHFAQNVAFCKLEQRIERRSVTEQFDEWLAEPTSRLALVCGDEGTGKTWATFQWIHSRLGSLPIVIAAPSSSIRSVTDPTISSVVAFIAEIFHNLSNRRNKTFWTRRVWQILRRGQSIVLLVDGLNQEPSFPWHRLFQVLQSSEFSQSIRTIATTQLSYYSSSLGSIKRLPDRPKTIAVEPYSAEPGGELDQMLALNKLTRHDLSDGVAELARIPRMFSLVLRFRKEIDSEGQATVNRLLWAYGRDELGTRAGRAFGPGEWEQWLLSLAAQRMADKFSLLGGGSSRKLTVNDLSKEISAGFRSHEENLRLLGEIVDPKWMELVPGVVPFYRPRAELIQLALGLGLTEHLSQIDRDSVADELSRLLDPIRATSATAGVLAAALSIAASSRVEDHVTTCLILELLKAQNADDTHRGEVVALAPLIVAPILDATERTDNRIDASARHWAVAALRNVHPNNASAWKIISIRIQAWLSVVECDESTVETQANARHSPRLLEVLSTDQPGEVEVLGTLVRIQPSGSPSLGPLVPRIIQGRPLSGLANAFQAAAVSYAISASSVDAWNGLKWVIAFNDLDYAETISALEAKASSIVEGDQIPARLHKISSRAAALLLWLTGEPENESKAVAIDVNRHDSLSYSTYLADPVKSFLQLERRHADLVLAQGANELAQSISKIKHFIADPSLQAAAETTIELAGAIEGFNLQNVQSSRIHTPEERDLENLRMLAARFSPDAYVSSGRRLVRELDEREGERLLPLAFTTDEHMLIAGEEELDVVRRAKAKIGEANGDDASFARTKLLQTELPHLLPYGQLCTLADDQSAFLSITLLSCTSPCTSEEIDRFLSERSGDARSIEVLMNYLAQHQIEISHSAASYLLHSLGEGSDPEQRTIAIAALNCSAPALLGEHLIKHSWSCRKCASLLEINWCSEAIMIFWADRPLLELREIVAPWVLLRAASERGDEQSLDIAVAAIDLSLSSMADSELSIVLEVDTSEAIGYFRYSTPPSVQRESFGISNEQRREQFEALNNQGTAYVSSMLRHGALLHSTPINPKHLSIIVQERSSAVERWIAGHQDDTAEFRSRVRAGNGFYVALCEALLNHKPDLGVKIWQALTSLLEIKFTGAGGISELTLALFRAEDSPPVLEMRNELFEVRNLRNDAAYFELVIAALSGNSQEWLFDRILKDESSNTPWRLRRAAMLRGLAESPDSNAQTWPEGRPNSTIEGVCYVANLRRNGNSLAAYWWAAFLDAPTANDAYLAWSVLLSTVDRRFWIWHQRPRFWSEVDRNLTLFKLKMAHMEANMDDLKRAMKDRERNQMDRMDRALFGWDSPEEHIDMSLLPPTGS
ncbi:hypothetical protein I5T99_09420 [Stenotrophomonas maltophilia]|nr:hypothetical protein [Stenotrophomonas maltophilia]